MTEFIDFRLKINTRNDELKSASRHKLFHKKKLKMTNSLKTEVWSEWLFFLTMIHSLADARTYSKVNYSILISPTNLHGKCNDLSHFADMIFQNMAQCASFVNNIFREQTYAQSITLYMRSLLAILFLLNMRSYSRALVATFVKRMLLPHVENPIGKNKWEKVLTKTTLICVLIVSINAPGYPVSIQILWKWISMQIDFRIYVVR